MQEAVDAVRLDHKWLPDVIGDERRGHTLREGGGQGAAQVIIDDAKGRHAEGRQRSPRLGRRRGRRTGTDRRAAA